MMQLLPWLLYDIGLDNSLLAIFGLNNNFIDYGYYYGKCVLDELLFWNEYKSAIFNSYQEETVINLMSSNFKAIKEGPISDIKAVSTSANADNKFVCTRRCSVIHWCSVVVWDGKRVLSTMCTTSPVRRKLYHMVIRLIPKS